MAAGAWCPSHPMALYPYHRLLTAKMHFLKHMQMETDETALTKICYVMQLKQSIDAVEMLKPTLSALTSLTMLNTRTTLSLQLAR